MKNIPILKILNIIALVVVAVFAGKQILRTEKRQSPAEHEEHGGHGGHDEEGGHGEHAGNGEENLADFVEITMQKAKAAGIRTDKAGPRPIKLARTLFGEFRANEENLAHITPRFPGVVVQVNKKLGDEVEKGETLVVIESNESLEKYEVKALIKGTVIARDVNRGEAVTEGQRLMTIADLSTLWVDLNAYPRDYHILEIGQTVFINDPINKRPIEAKIDYISPFGREGTQTMLARATIPNPQRDLRPGLFAKGKIIIGTEVVPVAVKNAALQTWESKDVVFVWKEHGFQAVAVQTNCKDAEYTEVVSGMKPGDIYAAENSFLLKAELGKDLAEHEH